MSYYSKFSRLTEEEKSKYYPISISLSTPTWCIVNMEINEFKPFSGSFRKYKDNKIDYIEFISEYLDKLNKCDIDILIDNLEHIEDSTNKEVVFLCWEKEKGICHRSILSKYMNYNYNIIIDEL